MAQRRGLANGERLGVNMATVTADAALVGAPCYVYSLLISPLDATISGQAIVADTTAAADAVKEVAGIRMKLGSDGISAGNFLAPIRFDPPWYVQQKLYADITSCSVTVTYLDAS